MLKILAIIGGLALFYGIYYFGYRVGFEAGITPTQEDIRSEERQKQAASDVLNIADKYNQLYSLCEDKYQSFIDGKYINAFQYKGQQEAIENEINSILSKYEESKN